MSVTSDRFEEIGALPLLEELKCFFSLMEPPGTRRTSCVQVKYVEKIGTKFGDGTLVIHVDRAIMACTRWWVQRYSTSKFQEDDVTDVLNDLFALVNYNGRNPAKQNPLIPVKYLKHFMMLPSSENGKNCSMQQRYFKLFQKAVKDQYTHVFNLFKFASPALVNHSLHQYSMHDFHITRAATFCPFMPHCPYCEGPYPGRKSIFGLKR